MGKKPHRKTVPPGRVIGEKTILWIWTTRIVPSKEPGKVSKKNNVFL